MQYSTDKCTISENSCPHLWLKYVIVGFRIIRTEFSSDVIKFYFMLCMLWSCFKRTSDKIGHLLITMFHSCNILKGSKLKFIVDLLKEIQGFWWKLFSFCEWFRKYWQMELSYFQPKVTYIEHTWHHSCLSINTIVFFLKIWTIFSSITWFAPDLNVWEALELYKCHMYLGFTHFSSYFNYHLIEKKKNKALLIDVRRWHSSACFKCTLGINL